MKTSKYSHELIRDTTSITESSPIYLDSIQTRETKKKEVTYKAGKCLSYESESSPIYN